MKFLLFILLCIALHGNTRDTYAWDSTAAKYMPLQVGNIWVYYYNYTAPSTGGNGYEKYKITGITEINGKFFYSFTLERRVISGPAICDSRIYSAPIQLRLDSVSGNLYKTTNCGQNFEGVVDSLRSKMYDSASVCGNFQGNVSRCIDTSNVTIFGQSRKSKKFYVQGFEGSNLHEYTQDIGLSYFIYSQLMSQCRLNLVGCYVNGLFLGDTTLFVGIVRTSTGIPENFSLSQNYPNPFNPVTHFKFQ
ncbi:MAG TPA: hypothetical protein PKE39_07930, partial [Ignavibacteria bacterium]|nr:hypothetical protein [Ignavibacteria bacterium]HMQ98939.1 hypothetical protein [Ignavibacteria bacterium]